MKIIDRLNEDRIHISFEVFPPKKDEDYDKVIHAVDEIATLDPAFISVTYGAGGGTSKNTAKIASHIKNDLHLLSLAHLTCASSTKEEVRLVIGRLKELGIENILALRGDLIPGEENQSDFEHASDLVAFECVAAVVRRLQIVPVLGSRPGGFVSELLPAGNRLDLVNDKGQRVLRI